MKALPFKIPYTSDASFLVQEDLMPKLYGSLHMHPEIQITLILESSGSLFVGDYIGEFHQGDIVIIGSNIPHVFQNDPQYNADGDAPMAHAISIFLGPEILSNSIFNIPEMGTFNAFLENAKKGLIGKEDQFDEIREDFISIRDKEGIQSSWQYWALSIS